MSHLSTVINFIATHLTPVAKRVAWNFGWMLLARAVSQAALFGVILLLARSLSPDQFGMFMTALAGFAPFCERYEKLMQAKEHDRIGIAEVISLLHAVNQGELTIQSMIFEPERLRLHLSLGPLPATKGPFVALELGHWLGKDQAGQ